MTEHERREANELIVLANTVSVSRPMTPIVDATIPTTMVAMMPLPGGASGSNLQPLARTGKTATSTPGAAVPRPRATTQEATLAKAKEA